MKRLALFTSILLAGLIALPASAHPGMGMGGGPGMESAAPGEPGTRRFDCARAADPKACETHRQTRRDNFDKAREQCRDKAGPERRQCMHETMVAAEDCTTARHPEQCAARQKAYAECQGKIGREMKLCVRDKMPPPDCRRAADPQRCEERQQARAACRDKAEPTDRAACWRERRSTEKVPANK